MSHQNTGITRKKKPKIIKGKKVIAWNYYKPSGSRIISQSEIDRCNKLVLPPAWTDVWISEDPHADLQATGRDAKGRLQYRYHANWIARQAAKKFEGMIEFADTLPTIRKKVDLDLALAGMPKEKVVALVVKLMDLYHIRVGNDEYARKNNSYGLTTLKEGHITIDRSNQAEGELDAVFEFTGKSGKFWKRRIWEDDLALLIEASGLVGGLDKEQDLFRYEDANGVDYDIKSHHINDYLDNITKKTKKKITAKDFRTWAATWKAASRLAGQLDPETKTGRKKVFTKIVKTVSEDLGNTPAVCKSSYIHPRISTDWEEGVFRKKWQKSIKHRKFIGLSKEETATYYYLKS